MVSRNIGIPVKPPTKSCDDPLCPFHGKLSIRGKIIEGEVKSVKMRRTVTVQKTYLHYVKKYMRYERRRSKILAHAPPCLEIKEGDRVRIGETRPLSKNVAFVVIEKVG